MATVDVGGQEPVRWRSESGAVAPAEMVVTAGLTVDEAMAHLRGGTGILWRGDFHKAKELLGAMGKAMGSGGGGPGGGQLAQPGAELLMAFERQRAETARRARTLGLLLMEFDGDGGIGLPRAPDVRAACAQAWDLDGAPFVASIRDLLGAIGAFEWRKNGVDVPALRGRVHPHYGVFAPVRGEYVSLVAEATLPTPCGVAFDIGTGTGVLAAVLSKRGVRRVVATDTDPRAVACARENLRRLGVHDAEVEERALFPNGRADLVLCNPPWLPGPATTSLEHAVYDPASQMLRGFLDGLRSHLTPSGEGWLVMSDLAERIGLRPPGALDSWITAAGLRVVERLDRRPSHPRAADSTDPLHRARSSEITSLHTLRPLT